MQLGPDGRSREDGNFNMPGLRGTGSEIKVSFLSPAGSMTGKLFPTGNRQDWLEIPWTNRVGPFTIRASLIDAANPFIFVDSSTLPDLYHQLGPGAPESLGLIESIRREGAVWFGLAENSEAAAKVKGTPKIAALSPPRIPPGKELLRNLADLEVTAFSMGKVHPSLQLTGAVCLSAGVGLAGTVPSELSKRSGLITPPETPEHGTHRHLLLQSGEEVVIERDVTIRHRSGEISASVKLYVDSTKAPDIQSVTILRSARRLFEGNVFFSL